MQVDEIHAFDSSLELQSVWDELSRRSQCESFFLSHAWFRCCLAGLTEDVHPLVLLVRDGSGVVGIAPLLLQTANWRIFPVRIISLMQNQDSPFADLILERARAEPVLVAVLDHLTKLPGWQVWSAPKVDRASRTWRLLTESLNGRPHLRAAAGRSPILELHGDWNTFWGAKSQRFKKTVRNVTNRMERLGSIKIFDEAVHGTAAECMDVFRAVAAKSWKAQLPVSVTRNSGIARFFQALTSTLQARGQLALWVLRLDGVPIATEYHVRDGDTVYALRSDFDEQYRDASPGAHLNAFIVRTYFERGVRVYDMGPGDSEYKQRWATSVKEQEAFWLFRRNAYGLALYNMERRAVPPLRRAREWWRKSSEPPDTQVGL